jgi:hypothetical protein
LTADSSNALLPWWFSDQAIPPLPPAEDLPDLE